MDGKHQGFRLPVRRFKAGINNKTVMLHTPKKAHDFAPLILRQVSGLGEDKVWVELDENNFFRSALEETDEQAYDDAHGVIVRDGWAKKLEIEADARYEQGERVWVHESIGASIPIGDKIPVINIDSGQTLLIPCADICFVPQLALAGDTGTRLAMPVTPIRDLSDLTRNFQLQLFFSWDDGKPDRVACNVDWWHRGDVMKPTARVFYNYRRLTDFNERCEIFNRNWTEMCFPNRVTSPIKARRSPQLQKRAARRKSTKEESPLKSRAKRITRSSSKTASNAQDSTVAADSVMTAPDTVPAVTDAVTKENCCNLAPDCPLKEGQDGGRSLSPGDILTTSHHHILDTHSNDCSQGAYHKGHCVLRDNQCIYSQDIRGHTCCKRKEAAQIMPPPPPPLTRKIPRGTGTEIPLARKMQEDSIQRKRAQYYLQKQVNQHPAGKAAMTAAKNDPRDNPENIQAACLMITAQPSAKSAGQPAPTFHNQFEQTVAKYKAEARRKSEDDIKAAAEAAEAAAAVQATAQAAPSQAALAQTSSVQASPLQETPVQAVPIQTVPVQAVPVQAVPFRAVPVQAPPFQAASPPKTDDSSQATSPSMGSTSSESESGADSSSPDSMSSYDTWLGGYNGTHDLAIRSTQAPDPSDQTRSFDPMFGIEHSQASSTTPTSTSDSSWVSDASSESLFLNQDEFNGSSPWPEPVSFCDQSLGSQYPISTFNENQMTDTTSVKGQTYELLSPWNMASPPDLTVMPCVTDTSRTFQSNGLYPTVSNDTPQTDNISSFSTSSSFVPSPGASLSSQHMSFGTFLDSFVASESTDI